MEGGSAENSCRTGVDSLNTEGEMPRDGKKGKKRQGHFSTSDITLKDFADCHMPQSCSRLRKSVISTTAVSAKAANQPNGVEDTEDLDWFDKDLDSFDIPDDRGDSEEDTTAAEIAAEKAERNIRKTKEYKNREKEGKIYPPDVWFHLSKFIDPVDVSCFARICAGSYAVTNTAAFWRQLYHRYYREHLDMSKKDCLPDHAKPAAMEKLNGLRARVIAAMFHIYRPLVAHVQNKGPMDADPHDLTGYRCLLAWHQPGTKGWKFCFKLQKPSLFPRKKSSRPDLHNGYNDIFDNPEEGCCVLQVICCHFASVPPVMGLLIKKVYMTLSAGFRYHRLRLYFDSSISSGTASVSDVVANLDNIIGIKVIKWWHPTYPFVP